MNDEYDEKIDKWMENQSDNLLKSCDIPVDKVGRIVDKTITEISPKLTEAVLKQYLIRDGMWLRIGETADILLDGYKALLLSAAVKGDLNAKTAADLIGSCNITIGAIKKMMAKPKGE